MNLKIFLFALLVTSILGYPTRPLDERSTELTAWLLVQNNSSEDDVSRKKIVPKSVFIAPDLRQCPNGFESDQFGKCVEVHRLDTDSQLGFLFSKIISQLKGGTANNGNQEAAAPTRGPVHLDIPIVEGEPIDNKVKLALVFADPEEKGDGDVAVVVAPTNGSFDPAKLNLKDGDDGDDDDGAPAAVEVEPDHSQQHRATTSSITTTATLTTSSPLLHLLFLTTSGTTEPAPPTRATTESSTPDQTTITTTTDLPFTTTTSSSSTVTDLPTTITTTTDFTTAATESTVEPVTEIVTTTSGSGDEYVDDTTSAATTTTEENLIEDDDGGVRFKLPMVDFSFDSTSTNYPSVVVFREEDNDDVGNDNDNVRRNNLVIFPEDGPGDRGRPQRQDFFVFGHRNRDKNIWRFFPPWRDDDGGDGYADAPHAFKRTR